MGNTDLPNHWTPIFRVSNIRYTVHYNETYLFS
jgi:hypothetical protein